MGLSYCYPTDIIKTNQGAEMLEILTAIFFIGIFVERITSLHPLIVGVIALVVGILLLF